MVRIKVPYICMDFLNANHAYLLSLINFTDGLAWDWVNEKLYWTDNCDDDIEVYDPATGYRTILIETGLSNPTSIVVDPGTRYVAQGDNLYNTIQSNLNLPDPKVVYYY